MCKEVVGFRGYVVTMEGQVISHKRSKPKQVATWFNNDGYECVGLWQNNKRHCFLVHRLVAQAYIPNQEGLPEVNHKDKNPANNHKDNLEWITRGGNIAYSHAKTYLVVDPSGNIYNVTNLKAFSRENDLTNMHAVAQGKKSQSKGWLARVI